MTTFLMRKGIYSDGVEEGEEHEYLGSGDDLGDHGDVV
jgi:hypothetical protein